MWSYRIAVSTFFFVNGFIYANWAARLPEFQRYLDVSDATLGTILLTLALGALVSMPLAGWFNNKLGSQKMTIVAGITASALIAFLTVSPNLFYVIPLFFLIGMATGAMDVSMNGQAVYVERAWDKPIMSSFHALFSVGMTLGAGTGAIFAKYQAALTLHFQLITVFAVLCLIVASFYLYPDKPKKGTEKSKSFQLPTLAILPIGLIAFCGMLGEGAMADWSAIFMSKVVGQSEAFSALTFGTFTAMMTVGRIFGDYFALRIGKRKLLLTDAALSVIGLAIVLTFADPYLSIIGFGLIGLGLSTIVPIVYSTAGNMPGVAPSVGIAMATTIGYAGFFFGPPSIGFLSDAFGLRIGLILVLVLFVIMFLLINRFVQSSPIANSDL